jgi:hypothetical protein
VAASFDEIDQEWLIRFLEHRIGDRRIIRLIRKCAGFQPPASTMQARAVTAGG